MKRKGLTDLELNFSPIKISHIKRTIHGIPSSHSKCNSLPRLYFLFIYIVFKTSFGDVAVVSSLYFKIKIKIYRFGVLLILELQLFRR